MCEISSIYLTKKQARQFILAYQGLLPVRKLNGKKGILNYIKKVGCIQFDPLNKVGENPHLVLQSRIKNYRKQMLEELLYDERKLLDGWDKNQSIYSVEDWPFFSKYRKRAFQRYSNKKGVKEVLPAVRDLLHKKGPISSLDLDFDEIVDWSWAPTRVARAALDSMYSWGELIVHERIGTRKVYDFSKKHIPNKIISLGDPNETDDRYYDWHVKRRICSIGMIWPLSGSTAWLGIMGLKKKLLMDTIDRLLKRNEILALNVEEIKHPLYIPAEEKLLLKKAIDNKIQVSDQAALIAPLDNLLWDRKLIKELFDFEYVWEVYKPVQEREYGYYVLPVLYRDKLIARCEPICNNKKSELVIKKWWWEDGVVVTDEMKEALSKCMNKFQEYLNLDSICYSGKVLEGITHEEAHGGLTEKV